MLAHAAFLLAFDVQGNWDLTAHEVQAMASAPPPPSQMCVSLSGRRTYVWCVVRQLVCPARCCPLQIYQEGTHFMLPWFERPIIYDVRARPSVIQSTSGSRDLQMVRRNNTTAGAQLRPVGQALAMAAQGFPACTPAPTNTGSACKACMQPLNIRATPWHHTLSHAPGTAARLHMRPCPPKAINAHTRGNAAVPCRSMSGCVC